MKRLPIILMFTVAMLFVVSHAFAAEQIIEEEISYPATVRVYRGDKTTGEFTKVGEFNLESESDWALVNKIFEQESEDDVVYVLKTDEYGKKSRITKSYTYRYEYNPDGYSDYKYGYHGNYPRYRYKYHYGHHHGQHNYYGKSHRYYGYTHKYGHHGYGRHYGHGYYGKGHAGFHFRYGHSYH
jgi:hypothetical protein